MTEKCFKEGMAMLCAQVEREPSDILLKGYEIVLRDLTDEQFQGAVFKILKTKRFQKLPMPAEILEMVYGSTDDRAVLAISKIEQAWRSGIGSYDSVVFDDPLIHLIINQAGGWEKVCSVPEDEWKFMRKDFEKQYKAFAASGTHGRDVPTVLHGFHGTEANIAMLEKMGKKLQVS